MRVEPGFSILTVTGTVHPCSLAVKVCNRRNCVNLLGEAASGHASGSDEPQCVHEVAAKLDREVVL